MSWSKSWDLQIDPSVTKALKKIPRYDAERILEIIYLLPANPYFGDIQRMKDEENAWRRRIGNYRIFYRIKVRESVVLVFKAERRKSNIY